MRCNFRISENPRVNDEPAFIITDRSNDTSKQLKICS